jgi:glycosyltransferase involved in cell wall biosynthesis
VVLIFSMFGPGIVATIESIKNMKAGWNNDHSQRIYPPSIVFDIDDNFDYVHPFNFTYMSLGTRDYSGKLLKPGDMLTTTFEKTGEVMPVWEDEKTVRDGEMFSIERNLRANKFIHETAKRCDGVTVTCKNLADYLKDTHQYPNVHVYPNSIIPEDYRQPKLAPHEGVRILWQGGGSHMIDWFPLKDAIASVAKKYPYAKFVIWGTSFKWVMDAIPPEQYEFIDWVPYEAYRSTRVQVDCDINLCPLTDDIFNKSKSAIKWYEGCMPAAPEATLAANIAPYDEIDDGETGLLYNSPEEFAEKLGILIEQADLRKRLGANARKWVLDNRDYRKTAAELFEFYQELRASKAMALEA